MLSARSLPGGDDDLTDLADAVGVGGSRFVAACPHCGRPVPADQLACGCQ